MTHKSKQNQTHLSTTWLWFSFWYCLTIKFYKCVSHAHDIRVEAWDWAEFCITWPTLDWSAILSRDPLLFPIGAGRSQSGAKKRESKWRKYLIIWIGTELKGSNIWNFISDSGMHWDKRFVYFVTSSQSSWTPATIKWCEIWLKIVLRLTSPPQ